LSLLQLPLMVESVHFFDTATFMNLLLSILII